MCLLSSASLLKHILQHILFFFTSSRVYLRLLVVCRFWSFSYSLSTFLFFLFFVVTVGYPLKLPMLSSACLSNFVNRSDLILCILSFFLSFFSSFPSYVIDFSFWSFVHSFVCLFVCSFIPSFLPAFLNSFLPSFLHSFLPSFSLQQRPLICP